MAASSRRRHSNYPQRRATLLPLGCQSSMSRCRRKASVAQEAQPTETSLNLATAAGELSCTAEKPDRAEVSGMNMEPSWASLKKAKMAVPSSKPKMQSLNGGVFSQKNTETNVKVQVQVKVASSAKRIWIHPEAKRILGSSCIAVVCLERLRFQIDPNEPVSLVKMQPMLSFLIPPPPQEQIELQSRETLGCEAVMNPEEHSYKRVSSLDVEQSSGCINVSSVSEPGLGQTKTMELTCTEAHSLDRSVPSLPITGQEPATELVTDYESESYSEFQYEWDQGVKFESIIDLDLESEQNFSPESDLELKPKSQSDLEPEQKVVQELELESESRFTLKLGSDPVCKDYIDWQGGNCSPIEGYMVSMELPSIGEVVAGIEERTTDEEEGMEEKPETEEERDERTEWKEEAMEERKEWIGMKKEAVEDRDKGVEGEEEEVTKDPEEDAPERGEGTKGREEKGRLEMESEDFCAVCVNGGELLCCDRCPKVYHLSCHIPALLFYPQGDWLCTLCRSDLEPQREYECESTQSSVGTGTPYTLSRTHQRRCEKLTLLLSCHVSSVPFHEPVSPLARNYYQIIKRPIDLSVIRRKLNKGNTLHYFTSEQFVDDVMLMFRNCATFNYPDSEVAHAGRNLEAFFLNKLQEVFPDQTFPMANQDIVDRVRFSWFNRKRKKHVLSGKKYYL